ncbi:MAG: class I SAM-dependent methyltransferase [Parvibaculum sp.]
MNEIDGYFRLRREMAALATEAFATGRNVVNTLLQRFPDAKQEAIEIAYELQAGSYTAGRDIPDVRTYRTEQHGILAREVLPLCEGVSGRHCSILDAGTGEGTGWYTFDFAAAPVSTLHAVDISIRRLSYLKKNIVAPASLSVAAVRADLRDLPYRLGSFDLVVTMHAIEPNGGSEDEIVRDLAGLSSNVLCLFEPDHASASPDARARMKSLGYAETTFAAARGLADFNVVFERTLQSVTNPLNPTSVICLQRKEPFRATIRRKSPSADLDLVDQGDHFAETGLGASAIFPVVDGIECLRKTDAILKLGD